MFLGDMNTEESRMKDLKVSKICAAVARSLDRVHMTGRSYLSLITGYSSLTMAFTCLYLMAVRTMSRREYHLADSLKSLGIRWLKYDMAPATIFITFPEPWRCRTII
ncbi:unnamed protein product, partial [Fusarium fujikuroi]